MKRLTRAEKKQAKKREKKHMRQALDQELREHRSSFIVFYTLRLLVLVVLGASCSCTTMRVRSSEF